MNPGQRIFDRYVEIANKQPAHFTFFTSDGTIESVVENKTLLAESAMQGVRLSEIHNDVLQFDRGIVAVLARSRETQVRHVLACLAAGLVPAVLTPPNRKLERSYYLETTKHVLARIAPAIVVTDMPDEVAEIVSDEFRSFIVTSPDGVIVTDQKPVAPPRFMAENIAFAQFSSGTTGIKKGVSLSDTALLAQLEVYGNALNISSDDHILNWLPLYHDMGYITSLHLPLFWGINNSLIDPMDWVSRPDLYLEIASAQKATISWHPNFAYAFMAQRSKLNDTNHIDLSSIRLLVNCSEPVTAVSQSQFVERFQALGLRPDVMTGCYAMAETTFALTHGVDTLHTNLDTEGPNDSSTANERLPLVSVGQPLPSVQLEIRTNNDAADERTIGEIWARAPFLADGYIDNKEATASAFQDGWYNTGDLGYCIGNSFYVLGRSKDVIIVAGHNVFPEDVEQAISAIPSVKAGRVACFAIFDERNQTERIIALAEIDYQYPSPDLVTLRQRLLSEFGTSISISLVDPGQLVKSSSGKISRAKSKEKWLLKEAL